MPLQLMGGPVLAYGHATFVAKTTNLPLPLVVIALRLMGLKGGHVDMWRVLSAHVA